MLSRTAYLEGLAWLVPTIGACLLVAWIVVRRTCGHLRGTTAVLAFALVASAALVAVHLLPGATGVLSRATVLAAAVAGAIAAALIPRRSPGAVDEPIEDPETSWRSWLPAAVGGAAAAIGALAYLLARGPDLPIAIDALTFHLPSAARWIDSGTYWQLDQFTPDLSHATYPHNGNLTQLAAMLPWDSIFAARFVAVPFLALTALGVFATARELGAPLTSAVLAAASIAVMPVASLPALEQAQVDTQMLAWFAAGCLFLLRFSRNGRTVELVLAGIGLGLAFGTKWYGPPFVAVVLGVWGAARLIEGRGSRAVIGVVVKQGAALTGLVVLSGGFWLLRNWIEAGNPVHPTPVEVAGVTIFAAPPDRILELAGFSISDYVFDLDVWREYFVPAFRDAWGGAAPIVVILAVASVVPAWRALRGRGAAARAGGRVLAVAAATLLMALIYTVIPYTALGLEGAPDQTGANTRYLIPALMGAAALAAWLAGRTGSRRWMVEVVLLLGILDSTRRSYFDLSSTDFALAAAVASLLTAGVVVVIRRGPAIAPRTLGALCAGALVVAVAGGEAYRAAWPSERWGADDPVLAWIERNAPQDTRIGLAGVWSVSGLSPVLPAFGPGLDNDVRYVGRFVRGTMRSYGTEPLFGAALDRIDPAVLIVGTGIVPRPGSVPREIAWASRRGYHVVTRTDRLVLLVR